MTIVTASAVIRQRFFWPIRLKDLGFKYATISGLSFAVGNMIIPENKKSIVLQADKDVLKIQKQYMDGLITDGERYNKVIDIWAQATEKIASEMLTASVPKK